MYEGFFNLKAKPFELIPNPEFLYLSRPHKKAVTYLDYGIKEKVGFALLTGEVGSGKTTIIRNIIRNLNGKVTVSKIFNTKVNSLQLISMINDDFGLDSKDKDKVQLLKELCDFLIDQFSKGFQSILIIDEAQNLTSEVLEEVRMLSNLETDNSKLLQIVLVGQPELRDIIHAPELRQLRQRISISSHIYPLTRLETEEYILHRLEIAGNREAVKFPEEAFDVVYYYSKGIPRLINVICDFLMLSAFVEEIKEISAGMVHDVVGDLAGKNRNIGTETNKNDTQGGDEKTAYYENEFYPLLKHISLRLDALEKNISDSGIAAGIADKADSIEKSFKEYMQKTDASLSELKANVNKYELERTFKAGENNKENAGNKKHGLFKRILGFP